jgi:hypothetical protein
MDRILISSQCYQSADYRFMNQLVHTLAEPPEGVQFGYNFTQTSVIDVGLAIAAKEFLEGPYDYFLSIDYDILFNPHQRPEYRWGTDIKRLLNSCKETGGLVGGPYLKRGLADQICAVPLKPREILIGPGGGITEMRYLPTGFTMVSREIMQAVAEKEGLARYDENTWMYPIFMPYCFTNDDGIREYLSLDFAFSQRVREAGYKVYLDTRIILGHIGSTVYAAPVGY